MATSVHETSVVVEPEAGERNVSAAAERERRILIVDDDEQIRTLFANYLNERYSCTTAADFNQAMDRLAREPFELMISDVKMPGLNGIELLRKVVERFPETTVIMVSGVDQTKRVIDAVRLGAFDYLIKPCDLDVLQLSVERALQQNDLQRLARQYKKDLEKQNAELAQRQAELLRLQAQLVHNEKMASLGQLAAGVAHELNNPAGFIYGNMDILQTEITNLEQLLSVYDNAELSEALALQVETIKTQIKYEALTRDLRSIVADCHNGAERIRDVVQNLRLFSRLDEAAVKKIDLHEGIESTIRLLSQYYGPGRISLERDYGDLTLVNCYPGQLNQVWMNLLVNAAQATGSHGVVRVATRPNGQEVVVSVSDTGSGIAPELLKKIFDPFFTTKAVGEGTGLGLSIVHGIVKRHGGSINVDSRPGLGTAFTVVIPIELKLDAEHVKEREHPV